MIKPEVTTRPLYWIAQEHGADYTDVLLAAEAFKNVQVGLPVRTVWAIPAIERLSRELSRVDGRYLLSRVHRHIREFSKLQGWASSPTVLDDMEALYKQTRQLAGGLALEPGFVHKGP